MANTAIYLAERDATALPKRITAALTPVPRAEGSVAWSPDSKQIAFLSDAVKPASFSFYVVGTVRGRPRK